MRHGLYSRNMARQATSAYSYDNDRSVYNLLTQKGDVMGDLNNLPDVEEMYDLAELFKVFGDSTRIRILFALFEDDFCVNDLAESLGMTQSAVSHQLKILKVNRLVKSRRDGKQMYYFLADDHVRTIIAMGREHIEEK